MRAKGEAALYPRRAVVAVAEAVVASRQVAEIGVDVAAATIRHALQKRVVARLVEHLFVHCDDKVAAGARHRVPQLRTAYVVGQNEPHQPRRGAIAAHARAFERLAARGHLVADTEHLAAVDDDRAVEFAALHSRPRRCDHQVAVPRRMAHEPPHHRRFAAKFRLEIDAADHVAVKTQDIRAVAVVASERDRKGHRRHTQQHITVYERKREFVRISALTNRRFWVTMDVDSFFLRRTTINFCRSTA